MSGNKFSFTKKEIFEYYLLSAALLERCKL